MQPTDLRLIKISLSTASRDPDRPTPILLSKKLDLTTSPTTLGHGMNGREITAWRSIPDHWISFPTYTQSYVQWYDDVC